MRIFGGKDDECREDGGMPNANDTLKRCDGGQSEWFDVRKTKKSDATSM